MKTLIVALLVFWIMALAFGETSPGYRYFEAAKANPEQEHIFRAGLIAGLVAGKEGASGVFTTCHKNLFHHLNHGEAGPLEIIAGIEKVYSKPVNRSMSLLMAYWLSCIKLRDDDSNDYKHLEIQYRTGHPLPWMCNVKRVIDGDTIEIEGTNGGTYRVRLVGIDSPEMKTRDGKPSPAGIKAKKHLEKLLKGQLVPLETGSLATVELAQLFYYRDLYDKYGRLLAEVAPFGEKSFNEQMLKAGHARPFFYKDRKRGPDFKEDYETAYSAAYESRK